MTPQAALHLLTAVVSLREDVQEIASERKFPKDARAAAREALSDFDAMVKLPSRSELHALAAQAVQKKS